MVTKKQWIGLGIVLVMAGAVIGFVHLAPIPQQFRQGDKDNAWIAWADSVENSHQHLQEKRYGREAVRIRLHAFDPNSADSATLVEVGLKPWQAQNILRYRSKGGKYKRKEDLKRLYGMNDSIYKRLEAYIAIDTTLFAREDTTQRDTAIRLWAGREKKDTIVELNSADTASLQYIKGIGAATARAIIAYRERLGGYYTKEQIREIPGYFDYVVWEIPFDSILPQLCVCSDSIKKIAVNRCSVRQLNRHPYLRFEEAEAIYRLRRNRFNLHDISDLDEIESLSDSTKRKIAPYLSFEQ